MFFSLCLSVCLYVSVLIYLSLHICIPLSCLCLSPSVPLRLCPSLSVCLSLYLLLSVSVYVYFSSCLSISVYLCLCVSVSLSHCDSLSKTPTGFISVSLAYFPFCSHNVSLSSYPSFSVSHILFFFLCLLSLFCLCICLLVLVLLFLARATIGTSLYVSLCQCVSAFLFFRVLLDYVGSWDFVWTLYVLVGIHPILEKLGGAVPHSKFLSQVFQVRFRWCK